MGPAFMAPPRHEGPSPGWLPFRFIVLASRPLEKVLFAEEASFIAYFRLTTSRQD